MIILVVLASLTTIFGISDGINWYQAGYGVASFAACLILPILLWVVTIYFYRKYKKEKA
jgi:hypothetical protein